MPEQLKLFNYGELELGDFRNALGVDPECLGAFIIPCDAAYVLDSIDRASCYCEGIHGLAYSISRKHGMIREESSTRYVFGIIPIREQRLELTEYGKKWLTTLRASGWFDV